MNDTNFLEACQSFASIQLVGLLVASTTLSVAGIVLAFFANRQAAAVRFRIWQSVGCGLLVVGGLLFAVQGIPLRSAHLNDEISETTILRTDSRLLNVRAQATDSDGFGTFGRHPQNEFAKIFNGPQIGIKLLLTR